MKKRGAGVDNEIIATISLKGHQYRVKKGDLIKVESKGVKLSSNLTEFENICPDKLELIEEGEKLLIGEKLKEYKVILKPQRKERSKKIVTQKFRHRKRYRRYMTTRREFIVFLIEDIIKNV